ncbi:heterokaryon incompatibility protein-domain-containing protein [Colletotrichum godetiae]|uniref:Heterokaryon incompatibility protein-domain-containing protein n=1 Tax=Colletotrichum godetiae TaxID=1209918 RepID=A0AAJ0AT41_9PEZI|nr:heterokaryon incompatibility protein-domain-containing protein [Colletotrichum godetiae]KAK1689288.1 heterokaryon incompatibility protein-domain-containing protein [Colletotrichum godetiae]
MAKSSGSGCHLCGFIREELIRRSIIYEGEIIVFGSYLFDGRELYSFTVGGPGLVYWRCTAYELDTEEARGIAVLNFDVETRDDALIQCLRPSLKRTPEHLDLQNNEWLSQLWSCEDECGHLTQSSDSSLFLPTRLIDGGQCETDIPRLVDVGGMLNSLESLNSVTIDTFRYAALSYCWGSKQDALKQVKSTRDTMSTHSQGIALSPMGPFVRDTVKVFRALNIKYLWVDALCIIQGDKVDWGQESQMMGHIYYFGSLTICPVSWKSCLQGYLEV